MVMVWVSDEIEEMFRREMPQAPGKRRPKQRGKKRKAFNAEVQRKALLDKIKRK